MFFTPKHKAVIVCENKIQFGCNGLMKFKAHIWGGNKFIHIGSGISPESKTERTIFISHDDRLIVNAEEIVFTSCMGTIIGQCQFIGIVVLSGQVKADRCFARIFIDQSSPCEKVSITILCLSDSCYRKKIKQ